MLKIDGVLLSTGETKKGGSILTVFSETNGAGRDQVYEIFDNEKRKDFWEKHKGKCVVVGCDASASIYKGNAQLRLFAHKEQNHIDVSKPDLKAVSGEKSRI